MNEKIQELYVEATGKEWAYDFDQATAEKFAELIIQECAELTLDYKNDDHYNGWLDYRDKIRQHFGVER